MVQLGSSLLGGLLEVVDLVGHGGLELIDLAAGLVDRLADLELLVDLGGEACCNTQEQALSLVARGYARACAVWACACACACGACWRCERHAHTTHAVHRHMLCVRVQL